jgi:hypothetical protein
MVVQVILGVEATHGVARGEVARWEAPAVSARRISKRGSRRDGTQVRCFPMCAVGGLVNPNRPVRSRPRHLSRASFRFPQEYTKAGHRFINAHGTFGGALPAVDALP